MNTFDIVDPTNVEFIRILEEDMISATGYAEPIAITYTAAKAKQALGALPERCRVECSENIIKNVKSVVVPNYGSLWDIEAAVAAGVVTKQGEEATKAAIQTYRDCHPIEVVPWNGDKAFYIAITVFAGADSARVVIEDFHINITRIEKNGVCLFDASEALSDMEPHITRHAEYSMATSDKDIVKKGFDNAIHIVARKARENMEDMDWEILNSMMERCRYDLML